jgi:hypothetical protein
MQSLLGKVVSMKAATISGFKGDGLVIVDNGDLLKLKTDIGDIILCRNEVSIKKLQHPMIFTREDLPYGKYICKNGREVIFNRGYSPIWEINNGVVSKANPDEWVEFIGQEWFYDDTTSPWLDKKTKRKCENILLDLIGRYRGDA